MNIETAYYTDIGTRKSVNQDSLIIKDLMLQGVGRITLAALCDGMGGLASGEIASATFIKKVNEWLVVELPKLLVDENIGATEELKGSSLSPYKSIEYSLRVMCEELNQKIKRYGNENGIQLGTTAVILLIINDYYMVLNIGDSRVYCIDNEKVQQLTHDQSYIQQQIDKGLMTEEEAKNSPQKSILLQCVGASDVVVPAFSQGELVENTRFLLCSDGFWRKLNEGELLQFATDKQGLMKLTQMAIERGESDNISAITVTIV